MEKAKFCRIIFLLSFLFILLFTGIGQAATDTSQSTPTDNGSSEQTALPPSEETPTQDLSSTSMAAESSSSSNPAASSILSSPIIHPDPNTGAATTAIPIEVPPGRKGVQPNLALKYNSNEKNGWIGVGWNIRIGSIQRNTKFGLNYSANDFLIDNSELVQRSDWGTNYYGNKIEGAFSKYYFNSSTGGWEVTGKDGTKIFYGSTSASRQDNANGTFKWMLDKVQDTSGNYMTVSYWKDQGEIYIDRVDYTGNSGLSPSSYVKFYWETRSDALLRFTTHSSVTTAYRLKIIDIVADNQHVRTYGLTYNTSGSTSSSILSSIKQYGTDAVLDPVNLTVTGTLLREMSIGWQSFVGTYTQHAGLSEMPEELAVDTQASINKGRMLIDMNEDGLPDNVLSISFGGVSYKRVHLNTGSGWQYHAGLSAMPEELAVDNQISTNSGRMLIDMNNDGLPDNVLSMYLNGASYKRVYLNTGSGWQYHAGLSAMPEELAVDSQTATNSGRMLIDMNRDGLPDNVLSISIGGISYRRVYLNTGSGWEYHAGLSGMPEELAVDSQTATNSGRRLIDINNDGLPDNVVSIYLNGVSIKRVYLNTGSGWQYHAGLSAMPEELAVDSQTATNKGRMLIDLNGDGLPDNVLSVSIGGISYKRVYLNTGSGWQYHAGLSSMPEELAVDSQTSTNSGRMLIDMNGDGLPDNVFSAKIGSAYYKRVYLNIGSGWQYHAGLSTMPEELAVDTQTETNSGRMLTDMNGDGVPDNVLSINYGGNIYKRVHLVNGPIPDKVSSITNGLGSTTTIAYKPSSAYSNTLLPFIVHTASSVSVNDGNGNISTTNYTYSGGLYNYVKREFRGFQYSKSTDPAGSTAETWFNQDDIFKGLPYDQITKDSSGNVYSRVYNTYQSTSPYTGVNFPYISQRDEYIYDGTASSKRAAISFTYDSYGNITRKYMYGDVDIAGDEVDEYTEYNYDTTKWILNRPSHTYVLDSGAVKRAEGWFTYDTNGNLLTETKWLNGGINPVVSYGYDAYGNQTSVTDPRGYATTVAYDSTYYTYPVQTTNHLGHTVTAAYDNRFGKVTSQTDPNGNTTTYEYDVFGRPTKVINPNDGASTYGTISYYYLNFGTVGSQKVVRYSTEQSGTANYIWDETYFDGLGRTIKARREGPDSKTIVQTVTYDQRGLKSAQSLPYFEGLETPRNITFTYDPAGRVTRTTNPDNTFVTTGYDKGRITTIDANDHKKVHEKDVYGRLVKVEEYSGTTGSYALYATTTYQYDALGNLTRTTDTLGNQTNISYDTLGRKTSMTDPDMGTWSYAYDANGNLTSQTDAKNQTIAFTYDALNRVTLKDYPAGTDVTYAYDEIAWSTNAKGRLTTQIDATGTIKFYYDKLGSITKSTRTIDSVNYTIETTYDALGRTTSLKYPDGETLNYTYDSGGNLSQAGSFATYSGYNALGQAGNVSYGNGVSTTYQYLSTNNRLYSITTSKQSQGLLSISYSYDNGGNILGINDLLDLNRSQGFTYDHLNRLTQAQSTSYGTLAYLYNQIGNMLSKEGVSYTYGGPRPHAVTATSDGKAYIYDANGNMTADTQRTISYDYDNMPTSVTFSGVTTSFVYDGSGARVKKTTSGITTLYISKIYECTNGSCGKYVFAGDNRVALKRGTEVLYYHQDHLNSSSIVTDATGTKVEEVYYYPFGGTRTDTGSISVNHKYTSQELDGETGLYYYGARYYNPQLGRFISADSIVTDATDPQDFNRYTYVLNNPLIYVDPSGNSWLSEAFHDAEDWVSEHTQEATGMLFQAIGTIFFVPGTYMLSQSEQGRAILLTELAIGAVIVGYFGPAPMTPISGERVMLACNNCASVTFTKTSTSAWTRIIKPIKYALEIGGTAALLNGLFNDGPGGGGPGSSGGNGGAGAPSNDIGFISSAPSFPRSVMDTLYTDYHRLVHPDYFGENARTEVVMEYLGKALEVGLTVAPMGPKGPLFGRRGAQFGYRENPGILNRGDTLRIGWSWHNGRNWFSIHGGKPGMPSHWHIDLLPGPRGPLW